VFLLDVAGKRRFGFAEPHTGRARKHTNRDINAWILLVSRRQIWGPGINNVYEDEEDRYRVRDERKTLETKENSSFQNPI
jgi:hypothetical protein